MDEMRQMKSTEVTPNSNYKDKYIHLIGQDAAEKAAKRTETNRSYGFGKCCDSLLIHSQVRLNVNGFNYLFLVPSENKRDNRTIEDVQAEIQAKKKLKLSQTSSSIIETPSTE